MRVDDADVKRMGGKAANLAALQSALRVPPFVVFHYRVAHRLTRDDADALIGAFEELHATRVAVRSSGHREDSAHAAYAGVFETKLHVGRGSLVAAAQQVLESATGPRVGEYESGLNLNAASEEMSVIVQRMVNSRVSGVCVTRIESGGGATVVEACLGLGEALVAGLVDPDRYLIHDDRLEEISVGYQAQRLIGDADSSGTRWEPVAFHQRSAQKLTSKEVFAVVDGAFRAQAILGLLSVEVEWAFEGPDLYFLQARAYTPVTHNHHGGTRSE
jgi:pyruvate, water dikinase